MIDDSWNSSDELRSKQQYSVTHSSAKLKTAEYNVHQDVHFLLMSPSLIAFVRFRLWEVVLM